MDGDNGTIAAPGMAWGSKGGKASKTTKGQNLGGVTQGQEKFVPSPNGKKGGPAHQEKVNDTVKEIESRGLRAETEERVVVPAGARRELGILTWLR